MSESRGPRRPVRALAATVLLVLAASALPRAALGDALTPTTVTVSVSGAFYGDPLTLVATVTSTAGTPSGSVHFDHPGVPDEVPVDASGVATATTTETAIGPYQVTATFHGTNGFADSSGAGWGRGLPAPMIVDPEPTLVRIAPLRLVLTMAATARRPDGRPIVGETLEFRLGGHQPDPPFDDGGGRFVCAAVTDDRGFATCRGAGLLGALESVLTGGGWALHGCCVSPYSPAWAKLPVLLVSGS